MFYIFLEGMRLCRDGKFRVFAGNGENGWSAKKYKNLDFAKRRAKKENAIVPPNHEIDAAGQVIEDPLGQMYYSSS